MIQYTCFIVFASKLQNIKTIKTMGRRNNSDYPLSSNDEEEDEEEVNIDEEVMHDAEKESSENEGEEGKGELQKYYENNDNFTSISSKIPF